MVTTDIFTVTILHRQRGVGLDKQGVEGAISHAAAALEVEECAKGEVSLVLVSDKRIRELNRDFAGNDMVTDVLSFSAREGGMTIDEDDAELGDIVVSVQAATRQVGQKDRSGHRRTETLTEELALLFVHGALHLLGHDHADPGQAEKMLKSEQNIMKRVRKAISRQNTLDSEG